MTMTSAILAACGSDEKTEIKSEKVWYRLDGNNLQVANGHQDAFEAFEKEMENVLESVGYVDVNESDLIKRLQAIVDVYNNKYIRGTANLQKSSDASNWTTIKTFTLTGATGL
jgi:ABC-type thiamine transport system substrate-binding protein